MVNVFVVGVESTTRNVGTLGEFSDGDIFDRMFFVDKLSKGLADEFASFLRRVIYVVDLHTLIVTYGII